MRAGPSDDDASEDGASEDDASEDAGHAGDADAGKDAVVVNGTDRATDRTLGQVVNDVSEKAALLVREEIELARAEVTEKINQLAKGAVVVAAAGVFAIFGVAVGIQTLAWLLNEEVFDSFWLGFLVTTGFLFFLAAIAGLIAARSFKKGAPPVPGMAIDEAKRTRDELEERFSQ